VSSRNSLYRAALLAPLIASLAGCFHRTAREPAAPPRTALRDSLMAADRARSSEAARDGLETAALAWLDDSVVYLRAGATVVYGRDATRPILAFDAAAGAFRNWQPIGGEIARDGRTGFTFGVATVVPPASDGVGVPGGVRLDRYIAFWRRSPTGSWRIVVYAEMGSPTLPTSVSVPATERFVRMLKGGRKAAASAAIRADSAFAAAGERDGLTTAFSTYVAPGGVLFANGELVVGPDQVREFYRAQPEGSTLNWQPVFADGAESGELAVTVGESVFTGRGSTGAVVQRFGKYITVWRRQPDGSWKFLADGGNASPPRQTP
jgi:ketosteroid isomerase-like protein